MSLMNFRPSGAKALASSIRAQMHDAHAPLEELTWDHRKTGVTGDDLSKAMLPFISSIRELAQFDDEDSLEEAYELVFTLKSLSIDEEVSSDGMRPSDAPADDLLSDMIARRLSAGHVWKWTEDLEDLEREAKNNESYGVEPWFPKTRGLLEAMPKQEKEPKVPINSKTLTATNLAALGYGGRDVVIID